MMLRQISVLVLAALLLYGCVGSANVDAVSAAKTSGQIQAFLQAHPNAKIVVLLQSGDGLAKALARVPECASIQAKSAYQVTFTDTDTNAVSFINPDSGQVLCAVVNNPGNGQDAGPSGPAASGTTGASASVSGSAATPISGQSSAQAGDESLVEYRNDAQGYTILKPASWQAGVENDQYLLVKKDEHTDALIWPIQLDGKYAEMTGVDLGNYVIGLTKKQYPDFNASKIWMAPDQSSLEVIATLTVDGVKTKGVLTTFVDANGHGLLAGYEAPVDSFDAMEPTLRKIVHSYQLLATDATKAAAKAEAQANANAQDGEGAGGATTVGGNPGVRAGAAIQLTPFTASDGSFHFQAPSGWKISGLGSCSTRSMAAYDPSNPVRREFVIDSNTLSLPISQLTSDAVVTEATSKISQYEPAYGSVSNIQIVGSKEPYPAAQGAPGLLDSGIFTATMTIDGKPAKGRFGVVLTNPSLALAPGFAYLIFSGEIADAADFDALRPTMDQSVAGFEIDPAYSNQCSASNQADITRRTGDISKTLSDTSDIITSGYEERSAVQDRVAQKWSDTTLGVDRVYNPDSDQVYQVPNDFYQNYDLHRDQFEQKNLQQLTPDQWNQYAPLDGELNIR